MSDTELLPKLEPVRRLEVFTGAGRRRSWTAEQKLQIINESYADGETVSAVARRHGLTPQQLFGWRRAVSIFGRNTRSLQPSPLARPTLGKKQPQCQHDWYF